MSQTNTTDIKRIIASGLWIAESWVSVIRGKSLKHSTHETGKLREIWQSPFGEPNVIL